MILNIQKTYKNQNDGTYVIGKDQQSIGIINTTQITAGIMTDNYKGLWNSIKVKILTSDGALSTMSLSELTTKPSGLTITLDNVKADPYATIFQFFTTKRNSKIHKNRIRSIRPKITRSNQRCNPT